MVCVLGGALSSCLETWEWEVVTGLRGSLKAGEAPPATITIPLLQGTFSG